MTTVWGLLLFYGEACANDRLSLERKDLWWVRGDWDGATYSYSGGGGVLLFRFRVFVNAMDYVVTLEDYYRLVPD